MSVTPHEPQGGQSGSLPQATTCVLQKGSTPFCKTHRARCNLQKGVLPFCKSTLRIDGIDIASTVRVKLCGLFRPEDVDAANAARPDYVGFVVNFPRSHRSVSVCDLAVLSARVEKGIRRVGVFVDERPATIAHLYEQGAIDVAQLHGNEDEAYVAALRALCDIPLIQAFRVRSVSDVMRANASSADLVLLDGGQGAGKAFDWSLVRAADRPFMLAGGLSPTNVAAAIASVAPWGVDMSSGVETNGTKDPRKMAAAVVAVRC